MEIDSLIVCKDCLEDLNLELNENTSCERCAICGWPINRPIPKQLLRKIFDFVTEYTKSIEGSEILRKKLAKILLKDKVYLCRYDLYYLIEDILENFDENLAKEFEERFAKQFDFQGSLVS